MLLCRAINLIHINCDFNKCKDRAETARHHHSCSHIDEENMELNNKDDYKVIKKKDKEVSLDKELLSSILNKLFEKHKAPSTNVNLADGYNNLQIVPSKHALPFRFTASSSVTMRNKLLNSFIRLLEGTETPVLTPNRHKLLSNEELAAIVRNATKNIDSQLDTIHANLQQHCRQH